MLLAAAITVTALALRDGLSRFVLPGKREGARRLELDSGLSHRPISERDDTLPEGVHDAVTRALWHTHRARMAALGPLRVAIPHASLKTRDPKGLRWYLLALLAVGMVLARDNIADRSFSAFISPNAATIDAWIEPPAYTGLPLTPITLSDHTVAIPTGLILSLRVHEAPHAPGEPCCRHQPCAAF